MADDADKSPCHTDLMISPEAIDAALAVEESAWVPTMPIPWCFAENGAWYAVPRLPILLSAGDSARPPFYLTGHFGRRVIVSGPYVGTESP